MPPRDTTGAAAARLEQERQRLNDYWDTFTTEHGKRVLADLEKRGHYRKGVMTLRRPGGVDPYHTLWLEGRRTMVLEIHEAIDAARHMPAKPQQKAVTATTEG